MEWDDLHWPVTKDTLLRKDSVPKGAIEQPPDLGKLTGPVLLQSHKQTEF